jgi:hypothetical protein
MMNDDLDGPSCYVCSNDDEHELLVLVDGNWLCQLCYEIMCRRCDDWNDATTVS